MAQNAVNIPLPVTADNGGSGATTLTDGGVLLGSGSSALTSLAVGATGTVLQGSTGADPAFTATPSVTSISFGGGDALSIYDFNNSWTPALEFGGLSTGITYSAQVGDWSRIGNIYMFRAQITLTSKGTATGNATITGIPTGPTNAIVVNLRWANLTYASGYPMAELSGTTITIENVRPALGQVALTDAAFANSSFFTLSAVYKVT